VEVFGRVGEGFFVEQPAGRGFGAFQFNSLSPGHDRQRLGTRFRFVHAQAGAAEQDTHIVASQQLLAEDLQAAHHR
jgi:hypothetical protein